MSSPASVVTPTVSSAPGNDERTKRYALSRYKELPFALPMEEATKRLATRGENLVEELAKELFGEPTRTKRRLR